MGTGIKRTALRVALTDDDRVVAFTASPEDYTGAIKNFPASIPGSSFDDLTHVGTIRSEEQILVSEDGVTPAGYTFAANRNIPATVRSITAQAVNLTFGKNRKDLSPNSLDI